MNAQTHGPDAFGRGSDPAGRRNWHNERLAAEIAREAALFISREAGTDSLITVTRALQSKNGEQVQVFVSVFPEVRARAALAFLERQREAFSDYLKEHTRLGALPRIDFVPESDQV